MARATVTSKGQITIPKRVRDRLGLAAGDSLEFTVDTKGLLVGTPIRESAVARLAGSLRHLARAAPVSLEEMELSIEREVAARVRGKDQRGTT
ncbi:MAG: AbrB/MazE/SpoVT family DNA-binding domain-containing protein [Acidobacteriota bacterium]